MGSKFSKDIFNQLTYINEKPDAIKEKSKEKAQAQAQVIRHQLKLRDSLLGVIASQSGYEEKVSFLEEQVAALEEQVAALEEQVAALEEQVAALKEQVAEYEQQIALLSEDNERMKRILNNDCINSSIPPSQSPTRKPANLYNGRKKTDKKQGAQPGHTGHGLSKDDILKMIQDHKVEHRVEVIGEQKGDYKTRYRVDVKMKVVVTELRIYADEKGKFQIPKEYKAEVTYGETLKALAAYLYSEGVVSIDRIQTFLNSITGDLLSISAGTVYAFCKGFAEKCLDKSTAIKSDLLHSHEICTDATTVTTDGKQTFIRNFSTANSVLYCSSDKKNLETLKEFEVLNKFTGTLMHDHETTLYHFGGAHAECNVHLLRYLRKNSEETGNTWSDKMKSFLTGSNETRKRWILQGKEKFTDVELRQFSQEYDDILATGFLENKTTSGLLAKKDEKALLNRLEKYKQNYLLFLSDFKVHFSNNMSEKDLRICKNRQKMAGGFRTSEGREMYCNIMSVIETLKRRNQNVFEGIKKIMSGIPAIT